MEMLKAKIVSDGLVVNEGVLKVDAFLNHQLDVHLLNEMGKTFYETFHKKNITKILTIEASGIAIATLAALHFQVPVVFAKKTQSINLVGEMLTSKVHSFTKNTTYDIIVSKKFIGPNDRVLILDDFLALGSACTGLIEIVEQAGAELVGIGIAIEKGFQAGGALIRSKGIHLESLAIIASMSPQGGIQFANVKQEDRT